MDELKRPFSRWLSPIAFLAGFAVAPFAISESVPPLLPFALFVGGALVYVVETLILWRTNPAFRMALERSLHGSGDEAETFNGESLGNAGADEAHSLVVTSQLLGIRAPLL